MMSFIFALFAVFFILPITLSIMAFVRANTVRKEVQGLKRLLTTSTPPKGTDTRTYPATRFAPGDVTGPTGHTHTAGRPASVRDSDSSKPVISPVIETKPAPVIRDEGVASPAAAVPPPIPASPPPPAPEPPSLPPSPKTQRPASTELMVGGKWTSYVGIALLLIGVAFMMGYAITHGFLGPVWRVSGGLLTGVVLIAMGHRLHVKNGDQMTTLSRVLTGGGSAIFYFCVFSAHEFYNLIGPVTVAFGLAASAAVALGLAMYYRSQSVGLIAVIGAFIMPTLIGDPTSPPTFLLIYVAVINVPVLWLGLYRNWQGLYNTAFGFTAIYYGLQAFDYQNASPMLLLSFGFLYFAQFTLLGLLKLRGEEQTTGRSLDILRLVLNSAGLLWAIYVLLDYAGHKGWTGLILAGMAVLHFVLMEAGRKWRPAFKDEILAWMIGGVSYLTFALPAQFDGVWITLGWALEGVILCAIGLRYRIPLLQSIGFFVGAFAFMKSWIFDYSLYTQAPTLFLNARFFTGLTAALLLGAQGWMGSRFAPDTAAENTNKGLATLYVWTPLLMWLFMFTDAFWTLGQHDVWAWISTSMALVVIAFACVGLSRTQPAYAVVSVLLLVILPIKLLMDIWMLSEQFGSGMRPFMHGPFSALTAMLFITAVFGSMAFRVEPFRSNWGTGNFPAFIHIAALIGVVLLVTEEFSRMQGEWRHAAITLWWAVAAISLVIFGLIGRHAARRYTGLALFGVTTVKLLLVDMTLRSGLERAVAFMGAGALLLIVAYLYQRAANRWLTEEQGES